VGGVRKLLSGGVAMLAVGEVRKKKKKKRK
jgi:hypothetical protein